MKQIFSKKAISPVVATALLLVVAVTAVVGFQAFFKNYQSQIFTDVEQKSIVQEIAQIQDLIGNSIYIKNKDENLTISQIKIGKNICNFTNSNLSLGISEIELKDCQVSSGVQNVMVLTNKGVLEKKFFIENGNFKENSQSNPSQNPTNQNCNFNSNSVNHGASVTAFKESQVIAPNSCQSETRICNNGVLSGSFEYSSCTVLEEVSNFMKVLNGSKTEYGYSVIESSDGGFVVTGYSQSYGAGNNNIILVKFDSNGVEEWTKTAGASNYDYGNSVIESSDGGFVVAGHNNFNNEEIILVKFDSNGIEQWTKTVGTSNYEVGYSVIESSDKGFVVTGYGGSGFDVILVKFDSSGIEQWTKTIDGSQPDSARSVIESSDGGFVVTGKSESYGGNDHDIILVKFDSNGIEQWTKTIGGSNNDYGTSVIESSDGGFVITGRSQSYGGNDMDIILVKFGSNGIEQWTKTIGGSSNDYGTSVIESSDGGFVITGGSSSYGGSDADIILVKFDSNGIEQWTKTIGGSNGDDSSSVIESSDGGFVITGGSQSYGGSDSDIFILKLDSQGNCGGCSEVTNHDVTEQSHSISEQNHDVTEQNHVLSEQNHDVSESDEDASFELIFQN